MQAVKNKPDAWSQRCSALFDQHWPELERMARNMTGCPDISADVTQAAFARFYQLGEAGMPDNPRAYLFAMVANGVRNHWRSEAKMVAGDDALEQVDRRTPDHNIAKALELERVAEAIANLPPKQRRVFELRRMEGLSLKDIARETGTSPKTVENHLTVILKKLRLALKPAEDRR